MMPSSSRRRESFVKKRQRTRLDQPRHGQREPRDDEGIDRDAVKRGLTSLRHNAEAAGIKPNPVDVAVVRGTRAWRLSTAYLSWTKLKFVDI